MLVCNAASRSVLQAALGGISDDQARKILDNNIVANNWLISMVCAADDRTQGWLDHHRVVDQRPRRARLILGAYAISKAADMHARAQSRLRRIGTWRKVNTIAPGLIKTDFAKALGTKPDNLKASTARSPLLRIGIPDEIAGAAVILGSAAGNFADGTVVW